MQTFDVDPQFLDYSFPASERYVKGYLGPGHSNLMGYSQAVELIPSSDWIKLIQYADDSQATLDFMVTRVNDQGTEGACVSHASTKSVEIITACTYGLEQVIPLSPMSLYKRIGRSASSGAIVMDGIEAMELEGVLPLDTAENRRRFKHAHPETGFDIHLPDGWQETAKLFKAVTWYAIDSFAAMVTALLRGHPVVVGREGHSIIYLRVRLKNGNLVFIYLNSWGRWGFASGNLPYGFGADSERLGKQACRGAYALVSVTHASEIYGR